MPNLSLSFFGPGQILDPAGEELILRGRKEFALLVYLALEPEHAHRRAFLGGLLWPEMSESDFRNNLRVTLSRLKNKLIERGVDPLIIGRQTVQLRPAFEFEIDTNTFERLYTEIGQHSHTNLSTCPECLSKLQQATDLYKGDFLQGFHVDDSYAFEDWMTLQRERFRRHAAELLAMLEGAYLAQKNYQEALSIVRRRVTFDPLQEDAHRQLMRLMVRNGERNAALVQYETCRRLLHQELGVPPAPETGELYRQIRDGELSLSSQDGTVQDGTVQDGTIQDGTVQDSTVQNDARQNRAGQNTRGRGSNISSALNPPTHSSSPLPLQESTKDNSVQGSFEAQLTRWGTVPGQKLFGIEHVISELLEILSRTERPWVVSVDGIGGIGKTSIARSLSRTLLAEGHFGRVVWVSAKQEEFHSDSGIQATERPALDAEQLVTELLAQLDESLVLSGDAESRRLNLIRLLKEEAALVVVDNLETVADHQAVVPLLTQLAEPSKVLITSRLSLRSYPDIYARTLGELTHTDTFDLIRHEATVRGIGILNNATDEHLQAIYDVVGGHPLALNLVLGQLSYLPLGQVLTGLQEAQGERIEQLYSYIYWQAWQMLDDASRQLFLTLPIVYNGTFDQLAEASLLETDELSAALTQLIGLSLIQVTGDIMEPRYRLHRLTETFLMNEVLKWQSR